MTGASSGIGLELARVAAARMLSSSSRGEGALQALAAEIEREHGATAHVVPADLSNPDAAEAIAAAIDDLGLEVDVLVNNAGFGLYGDYVVSTDIEIERDMIAVNVAAPTALAKRFGGPMVRRGGGGS